MIRTGSDSDSGHGYGYGYGSGSDAVSVRVAGSNSRSGSGSGCGPDGPLSVPASSFNVKCQSKIAYTQIKEKHVENLIRNAAIAALSLRSGLGKCKIFSSKQKMISQLKS